jgi:hypothetical protein
MRGTAPIARLTVGAIVVSALAGVLALTGGSASARALAKPTVAPAASSPVSAPATPTWVRLAGPFPSAQSHSGIATFGVSGVAVVGDAGMVAVSTNGGATWDAPRASDTTVDLSGVAFSDANRGWAVGAAGTIIATTDGGATWQSQTANVTVDLSAVDLNGVAFSDANHGWAVGAAGTIIATTDGGATWNPQPSPPSAPDLAGVALMGSPQPQILVGGTSGLLERRVLSSATWTTDAGPLSADIVSCAAGPGGVAYALSSDGHVERTLSYGAAPLTLSASTSTVTATNDVFVTAASSIWAPGLLVFEEQPAGGAWQQIGRWASPGLPSDFPVAASNYLDDEPLSTTSYRLRFVFAGHLAASATVTVGVRPEISFARTSLRLRRGAVYRLSGQVWPAEPGAEVTIWTNRGGRWHRIASGGVVRLVGGSSFATRRFGTPVRQSYELQVRLAANAAHLAAKSALVKVTVR